MIRETAAALVLAILTKAQQPIATADKVATFRLAGGSATAAAFAPGGNSLATGGELGDVILWDVAGRTPRWRAEPSDLRISTLCFRPDGKRLACGGRSLTIHDVASGEVVWRCEGRGVYGFAWSSDGKRFAFHKDGELIVRDAESDRTVASHTFANHPVGPFVFAAENEFLYAGDSDGGLWRIRTDDGTAVQVATRRTTEAEWASYLQLAWAGGALFELVSQQPIRRADAPFAMPGNAFAMAVAPDGQSFAAGGDAQLVRWWTKAGTESRDLEFGAPIAALALAPDGGSLCVATSAGDLELVTADARVALPGHPDRIRDFALSPDGSVLALRGNHTVLQPIADGGPRVLPDHPCVAPGRTGAEFLVATSEICTIVDGRTGAELVRRTVNACGISNPILGPGNRVLTDSGRTFVDLDSGAETQLPEEVYVMWRRQSSRAADGSWVVGTVFGIEGESGQLVVTDRDGKVVLHEKGGPVPAVALSPDGRVLANVCSDIGALNGGGENYRLRIRDAHSFALKHVIRHDYDWLQFLDGRFLLAADADGLGALDTATGETVQRLREVGIGAFALSADGATLARNDGREIRVFRLVRR